MIVKICQKQIVNPCQQVQYEYQYCPISGQGKIDNKNNVYQEMQHLRKAQGGVVLPLSFLGPLYVMGTYQEYEDQHKYIS